MQHTIRHLYLLRLSQLVRGIVHLPYFIKPNTQSQPINSLTMTMRGLFLRLEEYTTDEEESTYQSRSETVCLTVPWLIQRYRVQQLMSRQRQDE